MMNYNKTKYYFYARHRVKDIIIKYEVTVYLLKSEKDYNKYMIDFTQEDAFQDMEPLYFNDVGLYNTMRITTLGGLSAVLSIHEVDKGVAEWL